jgi:hypothetical protein
VCDVGRGNLAISKLLALKKFGPFLRSTYYWMSCFTFLGCGALPSTEIESQINYVFVIYKHKISFATGNLCVTNTYHLYVFVIHKHKINFGNAPFFQQQLLKYRGIRYVYFFGVLKPRKLFAIMEVYFSNIFECQKSSFSRPYFQI